MSTQTRICPEKRERKERKKKKERRKTQKFDIQSTTLSLSKQE